MSCDNPKYWLEEADVLDVRDKDEKFQQLSELVDDIDDWIKAMRACYTREQYADVLKFAETELAPRLCFRRLTNEFEDRISEGAIAPPKATKFNHATPIEFLRW